MQVVTRTVGPLGTNTYFLVDEATGHAAVVDPGFETECLLPELEQSGWHIEYILNTHAHLDHVAENALFADRFEAPVAIHPAEAPILASLAMQAQWFGVAEPRSVEPSVILADGDALALGVSTIRVIHAPGHSPGSVCFVTDAGVVVGDVVFAGSIGRTDLPGGDHRQLIASIKTKLLTLTDDTLLYPGHGPSTTVGEERTTNPYLS